MNLAYLDTQALIDRAKVDPRFNVDPLFTAMIDRLERAIDPHAGNSTRLINYNTTEHRSHARSRR